MLFALSLLTSIMLGAGDCSVTPQFPSRPWVDGDTRASATLEVVSTSDEHSRWNVAAIFRMDSSFLDLADPFGMDDSKSPTVRVAVSSLNGRDLGYLRDSPTGKNKVGGVFRLPAGAGIGRTFTMELANLPEKARTPGQYVLQACFYRSYIAPGERNDENCRSEPICISLAAPPRIAAKKLETQQDSVAIKCWIDVDNVKVGHSVPVRLLLSNCSDRDSTWTNPLMYSKCPVAVAVEVTDTSNYKYNGLASLSGSARLRHEIPRVVVPSRGAFLTQVYPTLGLDVLGWIKFLPPGKYMMQAIVTDGLFEHPFEAFRWPGDPIVKSSPISINVTPR